MQPSDAYLSLASKFESLSGAVHGKPGYFTWFFDPIGVATVGYGHALHHPITGGQIKRSLYGDQTSELANQAMVKYYGTTEITLQQVLNLKKLDLTNFGDNIKDWIRADTIQCQYDMLLDFAFNCGAGALHTSSLLHLHENKGPLGTLDLPTLAAKSKAKSQITSISEAFCAWSEEAHVWDIGIFHRRACEVLIYSGMDYNSAYERAWAFH